VYSIKAFLDMLKTMAIINELIKEAFGFIFAFGPI